MERHDQATSESGILEEIGPWTEVKHEIIRKYAAPYSLILTRNSESRVAKGQRPFHHVYIDAFAGAGRYISRKTGRTVLGSPEIALEIVPPFNEFHFIDLDDQKLARLELRATGRNDVTIHRGDCNVVILEEILPRLKRADFRRGLCLLDPYGLHLQWATVQALADLKTTEVFINFPTMDVNRNVLRKDPDTVSTRHANRLTGFWGDESWRQEFYRPRQQLSLFGSSGEEKAVTNEAVAEAYRQRLKNVAGFAYVPEPLPMRNSTNAIVYYLFFAAHNEVGGKIVRDIFAKYRQLSP